MVSTMSIPDISYMYVHWRRSALNSAGALRGISGNFHPKNLPMHILYYKSPGRAEKQGCTCPPGTPQNGALAYVFLNRFQSSILFQQMSPTQVWTICLIAYFSDALYMLQQYYYIGSTLYYNRTNMIFGELERKITIIA